MYMEFCQDITYMEQLYMNGIEAEETFDEYEEFMDPEEYERIYAERGGSFCGCSGVGCNDCLC